MYKFEKLVVWQRAMDLTESIYRCLRRLPKSEEFGLKGQLRRSVISIPLNIAEGSGAESDKEFTRYLMVGRKSLFETIASLKLANRLYSLPINRELEKCDELSKILQGLIRSLKSKS